MTHRTARLGFLTTLLIASVAAADETPNAHAELRLPDGHTLEAHALAETLSQLSTAVVLVGDGFRVNVTLPKNATRGATLTLPASLESQGQFQQGSVTFEVQRTGAILGGSISGAFGPLAVKGALFVRRAVAPAATSSRS